MLLAAFFNIAQAAKQEKYCFRKIFSIIQALVYGATIFFYFVYLQNMDMRALFTFSTGYIFVLLWITETIEMALELKEIQSQENSKGAIKAVLGFLLSGFIASVAYALTTGIL